MTSISETVLITFMDEDWDVPPSGFTRRQMLLALGRELASYGALMICLDRPIRAFPLPQNRNTNPRGRLHLEETGIYLFSPWAIFHEKLAPFIPGGVQLNKVFLRKQIERTLAKLEASNRVRASLIFHPYQKDLQGLSNETLMIYECYDEYSARDARTSLLNASPRAVNIIRENENRILDKTNLVITTSSQLATKCLQRNPNTHLLHNGVDYELFAQDHFEPPEDADRFPHPIIGYAGMANQGVDFALITACAKLRPEWSFVFLGPQDIHAEFQSSATFIMAKRQPNVFFWGNRPYNDVPKHMAQFDVCLVPYITHSDSTSARYPLKINEYLASGKPVVSTNYIPDFEEYKGVVHISPDDPEAFCEMIQRAMDDQDPSQIANRRAIAKNNSWAERARRFVQLMEAAPQDVSVKA